MKFEDQIDEYIKKKTRVFIDGMPNSDEQGTILSREEDFIKFEMLKIETEKKTQKEKTSREIVVIPINKIDMISEGKVKSEVNMMDKAMKALDD